MQLTEKDLLPGTVVQHFKRGMLPESERADSAMYLYEILGVARNTETGEMLVVYSALYGEHRICARPLEMFLSETDREKYPEAGQKYRFEPVK